MIKSFFFFFLLTVFIQCKNPSNAVKTNLKEIAKEIMVDAKNCALITVDSLGIAHARTMDPFLPEENFTVWMGTNSNSLKVTQIKKNDKVTLYYFNKETTSYVTLQGVASIVNSQKEKDKFWKKKMEKFL